MSKKQITLLKDVSRALIDIDKTKLGAEDKHILNRAYAVCNQQLLKLTGKYFMELEYPNPSEPYQRSTEI